MTNLQAEAEAKKLRRRLYRKGTFKISVEYGYAKEDDDAFISLTGFTGGWGGGTIYRECFHEVIEAETFKVGKETTP